jgi:hypothetical protein
VSSSPSTTRGLGAAGTARDLRGSRVCGEAELSSRRRICLWASLTWVSASHRSLPSRSPGSWLRCSHSRWSYAASRLARSAAPGASKPEADVGISVHDPRTDSSSTVHEHHPGRSTIVYMLETQIRYGLDVRLEHPARVPCRPASRVASHGAGGAIDDLAHPRRRHADLAEHDIREPSSKPPPADRRVRDRRVVRGSAAP